MSLYFIIVLQGKINFQVCQIDNFYSTIGMSYSFVE